MGVGDGIWLVMLGIMLVGCGCVVVVNCGEEGLGAGLKINVGGLCGGID